jgi:hypothetical protein
MSDSFFEKPRSIPELADYLDCTTRYITGEIADGNLRAIRFSNNFVRILPEDIREWMDSRASDSPNAQPTRKPAVRKPKKEAVTQEVKE